MIKLNNIRDILAVSETGSLRAGSRKLGIAQPTITRSIREIEKELGLLLFTRHAYGVVLTQSGQQFVQRATAIQSEIRHIYEELGQSRGELSGQVTIAISAAAGIAIMPLVLNKFQKQYPKALLKFSESLFKPVEASIQSGEIDFFVGPIYNDVSTTALVVEKIFDNSRVIVARKGHPLSSAKALEDLRGARWIRPTFSDSRDEADFDAMFERVGLPLPEVAMHSRSIMLTLLAVANSDLLTIVPVQWLESSITSEVIQGLLPNESLQAAPVCIVRRGDLPLTPLAQALCDMTRKAGHNYQLDAATGGSTGSLLTASPRGGDCIVSGTRPDATSSRPVGHRVPRQATI